MAGEKTIVDLVSEKAGISEDQAKEAVATVAAFLKDRLPDPIAGQIDGFLTQDVSGMEGHIDTARDMLGGLLGGKK